MGLGKDAKAGGASFTLSKEDGTLLVGGLKFHPMAVNRQKAGKSGCVFLRVASPGKGQLSTSRAVAGRGRARLRRHG